MSEERAVDPRPVNGSSLPLEPVAQPGYYRGFRTLGQAKFWDDATRAVIHDRVNHVPAIRFFDATQAELLEAVCSRIVPQDDRDAAHRIPIVPQIDHRLAENHSDGYRYEDMPPDREAYSLGLAAIEATAQAIHGAPFVAIGLPEQDELLRALHDGKPPREHPAWQHMPVHRFWTLLLSDCIDAYYAHPFAWDEIGFGGPAYPRGYMRLEHGEPEPWEVREERYAWSPPPWSASSEGSLISDQSEQYDAPGQGGTH